MELMAMKRRNKYVYKFLDGEIVLGSIAISSSKVANLEMPWLPHLMNLMVYQKIFLDM